MLAWIEVTGYGAGASPEEVGGARAALEEGALGANRRNPRRQPAPARLLADILIGTLADGAGGLLRSLLCAMARQKKAR